MTAHPSDDNDDMITSINITPMVDVVLVLLVIFMIAAPTLYNNSIQVELPNAKSGKKSEKVTLKFVLMKDGKIFLDKREISQSEISSLLKKILLSDPKADAIIEADRSLTWNCRRIHRPTQRSRYSTFCNLSQQSSKKIALHSPRLKTNTNTSCFLGKVPSAIPRVELHTVSMTISQENPNDFIRSANA